MLRVCHWAALLTICYWVGYVAAAPLPCVQWSRLSVWEASALADVWTRASEYLDFRSYALCGLSDLGYFDHLLEDFAPTLRVLAGYGAKTGLLCVVVTAAELAGARRGRSQRAQRSSDASSEEEKADDSEMSSAYTISDVRTRAYAFVARLLRDGPVRDVLAGLRREADTFEDFNVLRFFYDLDSRFFAVSDDDREEAYDAYCAWNWNLDLGFYGNWSAMEGRHSSCLVHLAYYK